MIYYYPKLMCVTFEFLVTAMLAPWLCLLRQFHDFFCDVSTLFRVMDARHNHWTRRNRKYFSVQTFPHTELYLTAHYSQNRQPSMLPDGIRTHYHRNWAAADPGLRPRGHWDRFMTCDKGNVIILRLISLETSWLVRTHVGWLTVFMYADWPCLCTLIGRVYVRWLAVVMSVDWPCLLTLIGPV
jgi:hypothetical protein